MAPATGSDGAYHIAETRLARSTLHIGLLACRPFLDSVGLFGIVRQLRRGGVWIAGFFRSGKSSFAKNLGYALQHDKTVVGERFATVFKQQIGNERVSTLLDSINTRMPMEVIPFEVVKERDTQVDAVSQATPVALVEAAVQKLYAAQCIRNTEDGWKLQVA